MSFLPELFFTLQFLINRTLYMLQQPILWHAQNSVHGSCALLYSCLDELQGISLSHPHITRCKIVSGVRGTCSGSVTGRSDFFRDFFSIHNSLDRGQEGQHFSEIAKSLLGDVHIKNSLQMLSSRRK